MLRFVFPVLFAVLPAVALAIDAVPAAPASTREAFLKMIDRPRVPLAPEFAAVPSDDGLVHQKFSYASESGERVPGILVEPSGPLANRPVVIVLHGTGGAKEKMLTDMVPLAKAGFVTLAIDGRYHGERAGSGKGTESYNAAIARAFHTGEGHPLYYDTVWDVLRLIDTVETLPGVDASRIGLVGFSKGGIECYLAAAADPRIAVAVPCIGMQSFRWELDHNDWEVRVGTFKASFDAAAKESGVTHPTADFVRKFYDRVIPGIYGPYDGPVMIQLIAPRPLLVINGELDHHSPLPGLRECSDAAASAYGPANAEKFVLRIEPNTVHEVTPAYHRELRQWLVRWLKP